jgi:hypothetical protein
MQGPQITFFVELGSDELTKLFADSGVAEFLARGGYALSMGILDLTAERAAIIRDLERRGVPVTAWLLLEVGDGYWLNSDNPEHATARYRETIDWAAREGLRLHRIGLDIEFPRTMGDELNRNPRRTLWKAFRHRRSFDEVYRSERAYAVLVDEIHAGGRTVESYHFPYLIDERATGRALLRRCFALVDVLVDVEVFMLYASYLGRAAAHSYFSEAPAIALGVTGGGVHAGKPEEIRRLLTWERLEEDLVTSARHSKQLYVFSLEGCVWRDFLPRFARIEWQRTGLEDAAAARRAARTRRRLRWVLHMEPMADLLLPSLHKVDNRAADAATASGKHEGAEEINLEEADGRSEQ